MEGRHGGKAQRHRGTKAQRRTGLLVWARNPGVCNQTEIWIPSVLDPGLSEDEIDTRILHQLKIYVELGLLYLIFLQFIS